MTVMLPLHHIESHHGPRVGGKGLALAEMEQRGIPVPETFCIPAEAYERYVSVTGLRERILLELSRKDFGDMRWEELWDASLRIRNMFLGAIIAREYGLPCVTGVPDAPSLIRTGDLVTVDGHLGIVTLRERRDAPAEQRRAPREAGSQEAGSQEVRTDWR